MTMLSVLLSSTSCKLVQTKKCMILNMNMIPKLSIISTTSMMNNHNPKNRYYSHTTTVLLSSLPYHLVVGLPALSPTMEYGVLAEWYKSVGESFSAGDAIAKIETDKAAMDFEAQDDGYVAKILVPAGTVKIGTPIMITVEDETDVAAFENYVLVNNNDDASKSTTEVSATSTAATTTTADIPPPMVVASSTPTITPPPPTAVPVTSPPPPIPLPLPPLMSVSTTPTTTPSNDTTTAIPGIVCINNQKKSPLYMTLQNEQQQYMELYGTTGQTPI